MRLRCGPSGNSATLNRAFPDSGRAGCENRLLRKMMSAAPSERVPRHRLVRNLIDMEEFEKAETEIQIFQADFRSDGPMARYRLALMTARAEKTPEYLEDRVAIMEQARSFATGVIARYPNNKNLVAAYCDLGVAYLQADREA